MATYTKTTWDNRLIYGDRPTNGADTLLLDPDTSSYEYQVSFYEHHWGGEEASATTTTTTLCMVEGETTTYREEV